MLLRIVGASILAALVFVAPPTHAAFPGANGRIAFERQGDIFTVHDDGTGLTNITEMAVSPQPGEAQPAWRADGSKIAFTSNYRSSGGGGRDIYVMNPDGSNVTKLTNFPFDSGYCAQEPAWSPDGTKIVFWRLCSPVGTDIFVINADGTGLTNISGSLSDSDFLNNPAWSPDGSKIAFQHQQRNIYVMNPDGTNPTNLTQNPPGVESSSPNWSPDGSRIAFQRTNPDCGGCLADDLYVMNSDGSAQTRLTNTLAWERDAAWSPAGDKISFERCAGDDPSCPGGSDLYVMNADGTQASAVALAAGQDHGPDWQPLGAFDPYPRPGGATPLRVPLVPAFAQCTVPNSEHVAPLAERSCEPPAQESSLLTTSPSGRGTGSARLDAQVGDPTTATDEADFEVRAYALDVQHAASGTDYVNVLIFTVTLQITDTGNGSGGASGTLANFELSVPLHCTATFNPATGSTCSIYTSADTLIPGAVSEGRRSVVATRLIRVLDLGPDGQAGPNCPPTCGTGDEERFLEQGTFTP